jgi:putative proteasome-type protease
MTFCLAMKVEDGIVGIADTQVTTGTERITARKVTIHQHGRHTMFVMCSGLRSLRDKVLTYFDEVLESEDSQFDKLYKAVNALATQIRRVATEDKKALAESGFSFNLCCIVGGQLEADPEPKLFLLYPQANWVEVSRGTPYFVIGESTYGKPLLDRALTHDSSIESALKVGYLAFDATRISATDVNFPVDIVLYRRDSYVITGHRCEADTLRPISDWWHQRIRQQLDELPNEWVRAVLKELEARPSS